MELFMLDTNRFPFVIISANIEGQTFVEAFEASYKLKSHLDNGLISYKVVSGCFDGKIEVSFLILDISENEALSIAQRFKQKCIFAVDRYREAKLVYADNSPNKPLGYFMRGESEDNYTIHNGVKYVCTGV